MKQVIVHPLPELWTEIKESPIPTPGKDEVVIRVIAAGSNVKDYEHLKTLNKSLNSGDDLAGYVHALGTDVVTSGEFRVGDRVAAFHPMMAPGGAYAEYAVAPVGTVVRLPGAVGFEDAATLPLVITTAGITLFRRQNLPPPWSPRHSSSPPTPLIIYGASSALGTFAIKLAIASNIHPIIAIAGSSTSHLLPLLSPEKGDALIDYRNGVEEMQVAVKEILGGLECRNALDAISSKGTWIPISQMLARSTAEKTSYLSVVSGANRYDDEGIEEGVRIVYTYVGTAHSGLYKPGMPKQPDKEEAESDPEWTWVFFRYVGRMLGDGRLTGHPWKLVEGGLEGVGEGLKMLRDGEARGRKFVYRLGKEE